MALEHCVLFRRADGVTDAQIAEVMAMLAAITARLDGASDFRSSKNVSPEGLHREYRDGFIIRFADEAVRDAYLVDEEHKQAGGRLVSLCRQGRDGLVVFDMEV